MNIIDYDEHKSNIYETKTKHENVQGLY